MDVYVNVRAALAGRPSIELRSTEFIAPVFSGDDAEELSGQLTVAVAIARQLAPQVPTKGDHDHVH